MRIVLCDHPGWDCYGAVRLRAVRTAPAQTPPALRVIEADAADLDGPDGPATFTLPELGAMVPDALAVALGQIQVVQRWPTRDLWDAMAAAIICQATHTRETRARHNHFRRVHGPGIATGHGTVYALPAADLVADLSDRAFACLGMRLYTTAALRETAHACVEHAHAWSSLPPTQLIEQMQQLPRVGPWTAGVAVADYTNDFSFYPHDDLALRTAAKAAAPSVPWPTKPAAFRKYWHTIAGDHLSTLTLFTLAWAAHQKRPRRTLHGADTGVQP